MQRFTIPSDELEFIARARAEKSIFWKSDLPSAFSRMIPAWVEEAWMASAQVSTGFFSNMVRGMLGKRKKKPPKSAPPS